MGMFGLHFVFLSVNLALVVVLRGEVE